MLCSILMCFCFVSQNIWSQQTKLLTADKHNDYGLVYTLPVTALEIEVTALRNIKKAAPFYKYAKKYTGATNVVSEDSETWTIESIRVTPYGVPDPESRYIMQLKNNSLTYIGVAEDGMLLSINKEPNLPQNVERNNVKDAINGVPVDAYLQYVDEDFILAKSSARQAEMLAEELMEIRDAKISLTRGTADVMPSDGRQLEIMLNSLDQQEKALMAAFTGSISEERITRTFTFMPSESGKWVLFRMSNFAGIVNPDDYRGEPVYVSVNITQEGKLPVDPKGEEKKFPKDGIAYCIPGSALINISLKGEELFSKEFEMAQFGVIFGLNPSIFTDKKEPSYAIFDSSTGALKEIGSVKE